MTKLSYRLIYAGTTIFETTSYEEAQKEYKKAKESAPCAWELVFDTVLTAFDPCDTPESKASHKAHREKYWQSRFDKELVHAPTYVNTSGVGAC